MLALITGANLWGVAESARLFMVPTLAFIVSIFAVIVIGLARGHPAVPLDHNLPQVTDTVGVLLVLKAFASGCSALTGVEAIANSVPQFRRPRVKRAQHTEVGLGLLLGGMLIGLGLLIRHWDAVPQSGTTVLAQLTEGAIGHNVLFYVIQIITLVLLSLAANTSFAGLPVLAGLLAHDNFLPHMFGLRADRRVFRYGVIVLAIAAALLLVAVRGNTQALVPLFAVGVFIGFTLSQTGMVRHWHLQRSSGRPVLGLPCHHQRRRRGAHVRCHDHRAGQQVPRRGVAGRDRHPAAGADVHGGGAGVRADRRRARDRAGAAAPGEAGVAGDRAGDGHVPAHRRGDLGGEVARR